MEKRKRDLKHNKYCSLICWKMILILFFISISLQSFSQQKNMSSLVARKDFETGSSWTPKIFSNRPFWYLSSESMLQFNGVKDEKFIRESGRRIGAGYQIDYVSPGAGSNIFTDENTLRRIAIREIEIFDNKGNNIAATALVKAYTPNGDLHFINRLTDGNTDRKNVCYSYSSDCLHNQQGWIEFEFTEPVSLNKMVIWHGYQWNQDVSKSSYITRDFELEYAVQNEWKKIPGTDIAYNTQEKTIHGFPQLNTNKIRLYIYKRGYPAVSEAFMSQEVRDKIPKGKPYILGGGTAFLTQFLLEGPRAFDCFMKASVDDRSANSLPEKENFLGHMLGEWDSNFIHQWFQDSRVVQSRKALATAAGYKYPDISNRTDAYELIVNKYFKYINNAYGGNTVGFTGGTLFNHYVAEMGARIILPETGSAPKSRQLVQMFARGASRQYQKPWGYYEAYYWSSEGHDSVANCLAPGRENWGLPVSLGRRDIFLAYLSGAAFLVLESEPEVFVQVDEKRPDMYRLSPHGEVVKEVMNFADNNIRGVQYTPILLLLDYRHGYYTPATKKAWGVLSPEKGDIMMQKFFQELIGWEKQDDLRLQRAWNSPYGDIFDIMLANPPSGAISSQQIEQYKVVMLLGDVEIGEALADRLKAYAEAGGTLLVNGAQLSLNSRLQQALGLSCVKSSSKNGYDFWIPAPAPAESDCLIKNQHNELEAVRYPMGKGNIILTTPDFLLNKQGNIHPVIKTLLAEIQTECLPFKIEGKVSFQLNKISEDNWLLVLYNNEGVNKKEKDPEILDYTLTSDVDIIFEKAPSEIKELISGKELSMATDGNNPHLKIKIKPGDIQVLNIKR